MSYGYTGCARKNLKTGETQFYPTPAALTPITIEQVAREISEKCTLTRADLMSVLCELQTQIKNVTLQGNTVRLGNLGSFRLSVKTEWVGDKDEVSTALVRNVHIVFVASPWIKKRLQPSRLTFKRVGLPK